MECGRMVGMEHQTLNRENEAPSDFRRAYKSLRLAIRQKQRKPIPLENKNPESDVCFHLTCRESVRQAVFYAYRSWSLNKIPDPIIGRAKRRLIRIKDERKKQNYRAIIEEFYREKIDKSISDEDKSSFIA